MNNKTLLTKYAKDKGCVILPKLIEGQVCIFNETTREYTLHRASRYAELHDDFNPDNYCVLHDWSDSLGYATNAMRLDYKVEVAYNSFINNRYHKTREK